MTTIEYQVILYILYCNIIKYNKTLNEQYRKQQMTVMIYIITNM